MSRRTRLRCPTSSTRRTLRSAAWTAPSRAAQKTHVFGPVAGTPAEDVDEAVRLVVDEQGDDSLALKACVAELQALLLGEPLVRGVNDHQGLACFQRGDRQRIVVRRKGGAGLGLAAPGLRIPADSAGGRRSRGRSRSVPRRASRGGGRRCPQRACGRPDWRPPTPRALAGRAKLDRGARAPRRGVRSPTLGRPRAPGPGSGRGLQRNRGARSRTALRGRRSCLRRPAAPKAATGTPTSPARDGPPV